METMFDRSSFHGVGGQKTDWSAFRRVKEVETLVWTKILSVLCKRGQKRKSERRNRGWECEIGL